MKKTSLIVCVLCLFVGCSEPMMNKKTFETNLHQVMISSYKCAFIDGAMFVLSEQSKNPSRNFTKEQIYAAREKYLSDFIDLINTELEKETEK